MEQRISIERLEQAINLFGSFDENIRLIESEFHVTVANREGELRVNGEPEDTMLACKALSALLTLSNRGEAINEQNVRYVIGLARSGQEEKIGELTQDVICISAKGRPIKPKTIGQKEYVDSISQNTVTIGVGPAGTGKTYLAVAAAVAAFRERKINRIILTRPAVEAGERLGFLPGDLKQKVDQYLRPLYDAQSDYQGVDSPYNTYINPGLTPGPICNPGLSAIEAAIYPADTDYYFFALGKDGKSHFFTDYNEHLKFINSGEYQPKYSR